MESSDFARLLNTFGLDATTASLLGASQNFVYQVEQRGRPIIARISTSRHRTRDEIEAELEWITFLARRGIPVCPPQTSTHARRCEELVIDGRTYLLAVFEKAGGRKPDRADLSEAFYFRIGRLMGDMHSASIHADSMGFRVRRNQWHASRLLREDRVKTSAPLNEAFHASVRSLMSEISLQSTIPSAFGLIHGDVNVGNCHLEEERLWIFDFDNCEYGYFLQDLAVMLYDSIYSKFVKHVEPENLTPTLKKFWDAMIRGYRQSGPSLTFSADELRRFFLLREAIIYIHYHRILSPEQLAVPDPFLKDMATHVETMQHPIVFERLTA